MKKRSAFSCGLVLLVVWADENHTQLDSVGGHRAGREGWVRSRWSGTEGGDSVERRCEPMWKWEALNYA